MQSNDKPEEFPIRLNLPDPIFEYVEDNKVGELFKNKLFRRKIVEHIHDIENNKDINAIHYKKAIELEKNKK